MVIISGMVVRVDFSTLPGHLRNAIMNEVGFRNRSEKVPTSASNQLSDIDKDRSNSNNIADEVPLVEEK